MLTSNRECVCATIAPVTIPQTFIQELLARADVVEIVGRHVQLKKGGANFTGLCPFHSEKTPSFSVSPSKQFYHCFGCGKNGNAISFLMDHDGMNFVEAVKELAQQYALQVPEDNASPQEQARAAEQREKRSTLSSVLEQAASAYRKQLKDSARAVAYLKGRGLSGEIARRYGLGWAAQGWRNLASAFAHYDDPLLVESGLVIVNVDETSGEEKRYDRFRERVMFPIRNVKGECIAFGGRVLGDEKPKYLNSPETPVFSKGRELYGLFEARAALREYGYALVTEGYMDVVALAQLGFPNAVATLGTACTSEHVQKLFRFTDSIIFSFDGDSAGRHAARKALDCALAFASDTRSIKFLFLPAEHDPDSFIRAFGQPAFARCISEAVPLSRFLIDAVREGCDLSSAEGRSHLASNAKPLWLALPEGALKLQLLGEIAGLVQLSGSELTALWQHRSAATSKPHRAGANATTTWSSSTAVNSASNRKRPASRADHALRLLLGNMAAWATLAAADHDVLCALPAPHGALFVWLEEQWHEHGAQPWAALREGLRGQAAEALALRVMADDDPQRSPADSDDLSELRNLLDRMQVAQLKALETQAIQSADSDPHALQQYRQLQARRRALEAGLMPSQ